MQIRSTLAVAVVTAALATLAPTSAAASSQGSTAVTCTGWPTGGFSDEYDYTVEGQYSYLRKGPYGACDVVLRLGPGWSLDVACYVTNDYGNTWSYAHFNNGSTRYWGYIYDANLQGNGSSKRC
ncbi:hypothetical protein AB0L10_44045 [Streptomyces flaveolus]|uniref:hypothetical protein n=1 Tax=Streptomyces flaveolus TaxID=67297 RepID=UPI00343A3F2A